LVVDDSVPNRKMLCRVLANGGYECTQADNGSCAVELVGQGLTRFQLVLMDFEMPIMNGPNAAEAMRKAGYTGLLIGITGNIMASDRTEFITAGANHVLNKPIRLRDLNLILDILCQGKE